ncbi:MAG: relaxase/mobilization nuclease domain-containing protein [Lachnospiraceae bacterium]|nr:relaxase/mobilization nuclease domain-containing protein [Lachnospiraceae bacterium]
MAITKLMNMKASKTGKIDVHLKNSIAYILNPKKLGDANLAGGINCLPELAYEQMKSTKELFGKMGGRQGYHYVLSLKPGEGNPEIMYDIAMRFAGELFQNEYEVVVAVHTDRDHIHAHLVFNSVNMMDGHKYQYHNGDWQKMIQPITNRLCQEYGLHITPAEYVKEPQNVARPQWEKEQEYNQLIKDDVLYCAFRAESMKHFLFLLGKLGYEVKDGVHIAVKAPGMKRFRRIDTLSDDYTRVNLEALIKYSDSQLSSRKKVIPSYVFVRRAKLTPLQKKYYARLYRRQLIVKQPFKYHSAYLQEEIRKMHKLQEEYLLLVKYDVKELSDVSVTIDLLEHKEQDISNKQKQLYAERDSKKRLCKTAEDFMRYEAGAVGYHEKLEVLKTGKKNAKSERKILDRIFWKEISDKEEKIEAALENTIPVGDMDDADIGTIKDVEVPENPYRDKQIENWSKNRMDKPESVTDQIVIQEVTEAEEPVEKYEEAVDTVITDAEIGDGAVTEIVAETLDGNKEIYENVSIPDLPITKSEYDKLSMDEKVKCFQFGDVSVDQVRDMVSKYLNSIGYSSYFSEVYEESNRVSESYEKQKQQTFVTREVQKASAVMTMIGMTKQQFMDVDASMKAKLFDLASVDYKTGLQIYKGFIEKIGVQKDVMEVYEEFDKVYEASVKGEIPDKEKTRGGR